MVNRLRTGWLAGSGALVLVLAFSGAAMGAPLVTDTTATFEDVDGDGVDDDCQEAALENTEAATAAFEAADLNGDGTISVTEAAQSGWTGGTNCNHGGYVSQVAQADDEACDGAGDRRHRRDRRHGRDRRRRPATESRSTRPTAMRTMRPTRRPRTPRRPKRKPARKSRPPSPRPPTRPDGSQQPRRLGLLGRRLRGRRRQELQPRRCRERGSQEGPRGRQGRTGRQEGRAGRQEGGAEGSTRRPQG